MTREQAYTIATLPTPVGTNEAFQVFAVAAGILAGAFGEIAAQLNLPATTPLVSWPAASQTLYRAMLYLYGLDITGFRTGVSAVV